MNASLFITHMLSLFWGWLMLIVSIALLIRPTALKKIIAYSRDEHFLFFTGLLSFLIGLVSIIIHNHWNSPHEILITLMGWGALLKGIARIGDISFLSKAIIQLNFTVLRIMLVILVLFSAGFLFFVYSVHGFT